jgi:TfoX/Sxy family transcriptional regulator of competence genes
MAYDEGLANRVRGVLGRRAHVSEKKMFGGIAFLLDGKMFCGVAKDQLMVRVGPDRHEEALGRRHVRPMDFTGRPMNGYVFVAAAGCRTPAAVEPWVERSIAFVKTLAKKSAVKRKSPARAGSGSRTR